MFNLLFLSLLTTALYAESGKVLKTVGSDSHIIRKGIKSTLKQDFTLKQGDEISTGKGSALLLLYPATQISLSSDTHITISEHAIQQLETKEKAFSVISFIKGFIKVLVTKDINQEIEQRYETKDVSFGVRGTEFELSESDDSFELDVSEGQIEASSPHVQSFVPEYVNANEGLQFSKKRKNFKRRKFFPRIKDRSLFKDKKELLKQWNLKKKSKTGSKRILKSKRKSDRTKKRNRDR